MYPPPPIYHQQQQQQQPVRANGPINPYQRNRPQSNAGGNGNRAPRHLSQLPGPISQIFEMLCSAYLITRIPPKPMMGPLPKNYDQDTRCAYPMNSPGHDTDDCWALRHKAQDLIDNGTLAISHQSLRILGLTRCLPTQSVLLVQLSI